LKALILNQGYIQRIYYGSHIKYFFREKTGIRKVVTISELNEYGAFRVLKKRKKFEIIFCEKM